MRTLLNLYTMLLFLIGFTFGGYLSNLPFLREEGVRGGPVYAKSEDVWISIRSDGSVVYTLKDGTVIREIFPRKVSIKPEDRLDLTVKRYTKGKVQKFKGYSRLLVENISEGIDAEFIIKDGRMEKLFHISPGADLGNLRIALEGDIKDVKVDEEGRLVIETKGGIVKFSKPVAYQIIEGKKVTYPAEYILGKGYYTFKVEGYDKSKPLVIDPLLYATLFGGNNHDSVMEIAIDSGNFVYVVGATSSTNLNPNATLGTAGGKDAFIAKFSEDLSTLLALTIVAGDQDDWFTSLAVGNKNEIYVTGTTFSSNFPFANCNGMNGQNAVVGKFDGNLNLLAGICDGDLSEFNRNSDEIFYDIVVDPNGGIYTAGTSKGSSGSNVVYSAKFDSNLNKQGYFLGIQPTHPEEGIAYAIAVDGNGYVYIGGESPDIGGFVCATNQSNSTHWGFLVKVNPNQYQNPANIPYQTVSHDCLQHSAVRDIKVSQGGVYITGITGGKISTPNVCQQNPLGQTSASFPDAFVGYYDFNLNKQRLTYLGGSGFDAGDGLVIANGSVYVTGSTSSKDFYPVSLFTNNTFDWTHTKALSGGDNIDAFIVRLSLDLSQCISATFYGGRADDDPNGIDVNNKGCVYIGGDTSSSPSASVNPDPNTTVDLPVTQNAYQTTMGSVNDSFVVAFTKNMKIGYGASNPETPCEDEGEACPSGDCPPPNQCPEEIPRGCECVNGKVVCPPPNGCPPDIPQGCSCVNGEVICPPQGCIIRYPDGSEIIKEECDISENCKKECSVGYDKDGTPVYDSECLKEKGCLDCVIKYPNGGEEYKDKCDISGECNRCMIGKDPYGNPIYDYDCLKEAGCVGCIVRYPNGEEVFEENCNPEDKCGNCIVGWKNGKPVYDINCMLKNGCITQCPTDLPRRCKCKNNEVICIPPVEPPVCNIASTSLLILLISLTSAVYIRRRYIK